MEDRYSFAPPRKFGLIVLLGVILFFAIIVGICFWQFLSTGIGFQFFLFLIISIIGILILPFFIYRLYALWGAYYTLERDGLRLHWGLRVVELPMNSIQWVYPAAQVEQDLKHSIPLPVFWLPGAILGGKRWRGDMRAEYMASDVKRILFIATQDRIFGISPNDPEAFLYVYSRYIELGSIASIPARSIHPSFLIAKVWNDLPTRYLVLSGFILNLILLGWVSLIIPTKTEIVLGFLTDEPLPSARFLLLPLVNSLFFLLDLLFGLFLYRRETSTRSAEEHTGSRHTVSLSIPGWFLANLLMAFHITATILFLFAVYFIQLPE